MLCKDNDTVVSRPATMLTILKIKTDRKRLSKTNGEKQL